MLLKAVHQKEMLAGIRNIQEMFTNQILFFPFDFWVICNLVTYLGLANKQKQKNRNLFKTINTALRCFQK